MADYIPISCSLHDELEAAATLRQMCDVVYGTGGDKTETNGVIDDLYARDGVEYLRLDSGLEIRLDHLIRLNGKDFGGGQ